MDAESQDSSKIKLIADLYGPCPSDVLLFHDMDPSYFLIGTYLLDEATKLRHGKICIYRLNGQDSKQGASLIYEVDCDAILDMKWYDSRLFVAHSTGSLSVYNSILADGSDVRLKQLHSATILDPEVLIMSLSVSSRGILTSHSDGTMGLYDHSLECLSTWQASDLEVWIQSFDVTGNIAYSGSDDGVFAAWDLRALEESPASAIFRNRKSHGAGVTAILPEPDHEGMLLTGSYDDKIRRFDLRSPLRPILEQNLGGGVWRIVPKAENELVVCCMYEGAKVIQQDDFSVLKEWKGHESMCYGGDVAGEMIGTCSFYDKRVCIWQ